MTIFATLLEKTNFWLVSCPGIVLYSLLLSIPFNELHSQTVADSLQQIRIDSVAKIPFLVKTFKADESDVKFDLDSSSSLLRKLSDNDRSLNNFYSPQFHLANFRHSMKLYDHGINSMSFPMCGFDNYSFLLPNKPVAEILTHRGRAFSNSQTAFSDNIDIHLIFAENFRNRMLWNFSYDKDNYKGIYAFNRQKNSLFTTGVQYSGKKDKFHLNVIYVDERHSTENNWGITSDTIFSNSNYAIRESVPVNNTIATTTLYERSIGFNTDFPINLKIDLFNPILYVKSFYTDYSFLYSDSGIDSLKRSIQPFKLDSSAISNVLTQKMWTNAVGLRLLSTAKIESKIGFRYEYQVYDHDTLGATRNVFQFEVTGKYRITDNFEFNGIAATKKFEQSFAPDIQLGIQLKNQSYFNGRFNVFIKSDPIPYIYQKLVLNKNYYWHNNFQNTFIKESGLSITLNTEKIIRSEFNLTLSSFSNFIFLNSYSFPTTLNNIHKLSLQFNLPISIDWLHFNSKFNYDLLDPDPAHFSGWNSSHRLSFSHTLFKKVVNSELGASLKLYSYKYKLKFNPIIQLYYPSDIPNDLIYSFGIFMHFRVSDFKFLIDVDNLDSFWIKKRPSLVESYPFYDFYFKIGIQWKFLN